MKRTAFLTTCFCFIALIGLSACGLTPEASYPTRPDASGGEIVYSDEKRDTIFGNEETLGSRLFGSDEDDDSAGGSGIGVNSYLWRASLDTVSFMPVQSADPFGGVILTDWFENPETPGERYKINVYIMDRQLRSDGVRVAVFKQVASGNRWRDAAIADTLEVEIEDTILTRARELRVSQESAR